ncbi:MAG: DegV family protein [Dehalococcoidia bacterium]|nr:DegV family protein [Dehalococcoidia bacterium]
MPARVVTDSTCDRPLSLAQEHGAVVAPLAVSFGDEHFLGGDERQANAFSRSVDRLFALATAGPSVSRIVVGCGSKDAEARAFLDRLRPVLPAGDLCLGRPGPVVGTQAGPNVFGVCLVARE